MDDFFKLSEDWGELLNEGSIVPYGIGRIGRRVLPALLNEFKIPFLIDRRKESEKVLGRNVLDLAEAVPVIKEKNLKIVVTTVIRMMKLQKNLRNVGLRSINTFVCLRDLLKSGICGGEIGVFFQR